MKIVVDDKIPFIRGVLEPFARVVYLPGAKISASDVADADALVIRTRTRCNAGLLNGSGVKFIATATIGFDHIDTDYCRQAGIRWVNAPGCNSGSVMQYIGSTLAQLSRKTGASLKGATIGVVGVGNVGSKVARLADALGMKVLLNDPPRQRSEKSNAFIDLNELLEKSDIVTLHTPLTKEGIDKTWHLINRDALSVMKDGSWLINTSRGEVVDNAALLQAITLGKISSAALDVWENEPEINKNLLAKVDIATPHIAGYSQDGKANGTAMSVQALAAFFGWSLTGWSPEGLYQPKERLINLTTEPDEEKAFKRAIVHTYDVMDDDRRLRNNVEEFEKQRGQYPARREFGAYTVSLPAGNEILRRRFVNAGFQILDEE